MVNICIYEFYEQMIILCLMPIQISLLIIILAVQYTH